MSTKEYPDDDLDGLFRKSAEEFEPPYDPADWQDLRKRLAANDRLPLAARLRSWWPWLALLLVLLGGGGIYLGTQGEEPQEARKVPKTAPAATDPPAVVSGRPRADEVESRAPQPGLEAGSDAPQRGYNSISKRQEITIKKAAPAAAKTLPRSLPNVSGVRKQPSRPQAGRGDGALLSSTTPVVPATEARGDFIPGQPVLDPTADPARESTARTAISTPAALVPQRFDSSGRWVARAVEPVPDSSSVQAESEARYSRTRPRWAIRLGVSPDLSSVGINKFTSPRVAASMLVEYAVLPRLYVQSGVVRSLKEYRALPSQYEWPANWKQNVLPASVDGTCSVFEVPLNVRYELTQRERSGWSVGLGVSSYKMQKEVYTYNYHQYDPGIKWYHWEGKTGWYWLSHLNASVGYEYRVSRRLSLVAEPYARVPLRRVGFGKVNLFTVGTWMSVRYTPTFR
ncbi:hypothetical protein GCM10027275_03520 [Rhabdobacter roseus]|uniref:PorT family protein n=1 Tax=Rhabdobacter roseus TaxID=1655419 RepID=A0A840TL01_9BACT|nr:hypothetical protein [Rhabdobacter roseus]MBB5282242.1 hypothetical protein [Rhabdobacter roseus]